MVFYRIVTENPQNKDNKTWNKSATDKLTVLTYLLTYLLTVLRIKIDWHLLKL